MAMQEFDPVAGLPETLAPGLRRILAPNPSPMTFRGTNTYLLGDTTLCVIDPGPDSPAHLKALLSAIGRARVSHIVVTHSHLDHSPLAGPLGRATGAPVLAFGDSRAGRSAIMRRLAAAGSGAGGEGVDVTFQPDWIVTDGARIQGDDWHLDVLHTPGHFGNHICLRWNAAIFSGDHVMGWSSSLVSPPDGDLGDYMRSCQRLKAQGARIFYPAHGAPVSDPTARLDALIAHRALREAQVLAALGRGPATPAALTQAIYTDTSPALHRAAQRNVFAHLIDLVERELVTASPELAIDAVFRHDPYVPSIEDTSGQPQS